MSTENGTEDTTIENQNSGNPDQVNKETPTQTADQSQQPTDQQEQKQPTEEGDKTFADLDEDTRTWLEKRGLKSIAEVAKTAHEQSKLLGNAIRIPGKDATEEEREAFLNKLGRPEKPDGYKFAPPENLPEGLPYDGERAKGFADLAHKLGLTADQAKGIHDWAAENAIGDFKAGSEVKHQQTVETAKAETEKLVKAWGPLDGETMKVNLSFADKALNEIGGPEALAEFRRVGLIGSEGDKVVTSAPIAMMLAKIGRTLYKEDDVLRGNPSKLNNPFEDGKDFNVTAQMKLIRADRAGALEMIAAAGKKPSDFGLKD